VGDDWYKHTRKNDKIDLAQPHSAFYNFFCNLNFELKCFLVKSNFDMAYRRPFLAEIMYWCHLQINSHQLHCESGGIKIEICFTIKYLMLLIMIYAFFIKRSNWFVLSLTKTSKCFAHYPG